MAKSGGDFFSSHFGSGWSVKTSRLKRASWSFGSKISCARNSIGFEGARRNYEFLLVGKASRMTGGVFIFPFPFSGKLYLRYSCFACFGKDSKAPVCFTGLVAPRQVEYLPISVKQI